MRAPTLVALLLTLAMAGCLATAPSMSEEQVRRTNALSDRSLIGRMQAARQAQLRAEELARLEAERLAAPRTAPELSNALQAGLYRCDLKRQVEVVSVQADRRGAMLRWKKQVFEMIAVQANTGAVRLENQQTGLVWISIVGKSMLLDTQNGKQLANDCRLGDGSAAAS